MFNLKKPSKRLKLWRLKKKDTFFWGRRDIKIYPKRKKFKTKQLYTMPSYKSDWRRAFKIRKKSVRKHILEVRKKIEDKQKLLPTKPASAEISTELRNKVYSFKRVLAATIIVADSGFFNAICNRVESRTAFISSQVFPLALNESFNLHEQSLSKLHDADQFEQRVSRVSVSKSKNKITPKRFNTKFINRFSTHGKTQRAAKNFGQALSRVVMFSRFGAITNQDIVSNYEDAALMFKILRAATVNDVLYPKLQVLNYRARIRDNLRSGPAELGQMFGNMYNTAFMFNRLKELAPTYSATPRRVDKARYKNMRGKTGRYTLKVKRIPQNKSVVYGLIYLKFQWIFSEQANYLNRFTHILMSLLYYPKGTFGYTVSRKVVKKILDR